MPGLPIGKQMAVVAEHWGFPVCSAKLNKMSRVDKAYGLSPNFHPSEIKNFDLTLEEPVFIHFPFLLSFKILFRSSHGFKNDCFMKKQTFQSLGPILLLLIYCFSQNCFPGPNQYCLETISSKSVILSRERGGGREWGEEKKCREKKW